MSLKDIYALSQEEQKNYLIRMNDVLDDMQLVKVDVANDDTIFLMAEVLVKGKKIGTMSYIVYHDFDDIDESKDSHMSMTFDFCAFDGFDFVGCPHGDNLFNFIKDDSDNETADMIFAHLWGFAHFLEFVRVYKTKALMVKNIDIFSKKFIQPHVSSMQTAFMSDEFLIAVLCGEQVFKHTYPYTNYFKSIKEFSDAIVEKFVDKYAVAERTS